MGLQVIFSHEIITTPLSSLLGGERGLCLSLLRLQRLRTKTSARHMVGVQYDSTSPAMEGCQEAGVLLLSLASPTNVLSSLLEDCGAFEVQLLCSLGRAGGLPAPPPLFPSPVSDAWKHPGSCRASQVSGHVLIPLGMNPFSS